jgi:hypothetical protein
MKSWFGVKRNRLWIAIPDGENLAAALAIAAYLGVAIVGLSHSHNQQRESGDQRQEAQNPTADGRQDAPENQEANSEDKTPEWYSAAADWVLVLVAAITAWAALRTLKSINRDVRASTRAAKAAEVTAAVAERTMILSHRAVIHIARFKFRQWGAEHPEIEITLMNSGALGAILISARVGGAFAVMPNVPHPSSLPSIPLSAIIPPNVIAEPIVLAISHGGVGWNNATWKDILDGKTRLCIYGSMAYETGLLNASGETGFGFEFVAGMSQQGDYASRFAATTATGYNYTK